MGPTRVGQRGHTLRAGFQIACPSILMARPNEAVRLTLTVHCELMFHALEESDTDGLLFFPILLQVKLPPKVRE